MGIGLELGRGVLFANQGTWLGKTVALLSTVFRG